MALTILCISFVLFLILGVPVAFAIGLSAVCTILYEGLPVAVVFQRMTSGMTVFSFLAIPFYLIMNHYGLHDNPWSVIAALVTFATPYAIFIFAQYGKSIPMELDESARIDGANPLQIYLYVYLPLMAPALSRA